MADKKRKSQSFFWPILLIGAGVVFLMSNLGMIHASYWGLLWRLWPLFLVAIGLDVLIGRTSRLGAIISALVIISLVAGVALLGFFAERIEFVDQLTPESEWVTTRLEHPRGDLSSARIAIDWSSQPGTLYALDDSDLLLSGKITYQGSLLFDVDEEGNFASVNIDTQFSGIWYPDGSMSSRDGKWEIGLTPSIPLELQLDAGSGACRFDLSGLMVRDLFLDSGSGAVELILPSESSFEGEIDSGSGSLEIIVPDEVGARIVLDSGSGAFRPDNRFRFVSGDEDDDGIWETENYQTASVTIQLRIDQGSGSIVITGER